MWAETALLVLSQLASCVLTRAVIVPRVILSNLPRRQHPPPLLYSPASTEKSCHHQNNYRAKNPSTPSFAENDEEEEEEDSDEEDLKQYLFERVEEGEGEISEQRPPAALELALGGAAAAAGNNTSNISEEGRWTSSRFAAAVRGLEGSLHVAAMLFCVTFTAGLMCLSILLLELLDLMSERVRGDVVRVELWILVLMVQAVLPGTLVALFAVSLFGDFRSRRRWLGLLLAAALAAGCVYLPFRLGDSFAARPRGGALKLLLKEPHGFRGFLSPANLGLFITRLGLAGVFIVSPLAGYGAVDFPYRRFIVRATTEDTNVTASQLRVARERIVMIRKTLELRKWELSVQLARKSPSAAGPEGRPADSAASDLQKEIAALRRLRNELTADLHLAAEAYEASGGALLGRLAWPMTAACAFRMGLACYNLWHHRSRRVDPVSAISRFVFRIEALPPWTSYVSFILMGVLVTICLKGILENVSCCRAMESHSTSVVVRQQMGRVLRRVRQRQVATASLVFITYLMGLFFLAYTLLLRNIMPPRFQRIFLAAAGDQQRELLSLTLLNDGVFLISASASALVLAARWYASRRKARRRMLLGFV